MLLQGQLQLFVSGQLDNLTVSEQSHASSQDSMELALVAHDHGTVEHASAATIPKLLVLVVSCHKHTDKWYALRKWAERAHPGGTVLVLAGLPHGVNSLGEPYKLSLANGTLFVDSSDAYEALPEKMVRAYTSVRDAPELQHITHLIKVDDTTVLDNTTTWSQLNVTLMTTSLTGHDGDYFTSEAGYVVSNCSQPHSTCVLDWHLSKRLPSTSYWFNRTFTCHDTLPYADGGYGYILSRRALDHIAKQWPLDTMEELRYTHIYEDLAVGMALKGSGVNLVGIRIQGMPTYDW
eukprot:CAMPEP_0117465778 /NCGR_PEP_ID=MMETSP0784-20121206/4801_1 /TAXON_ID=39447 /ORGANISM="" /LENGTH=291 /DNA_ID=CAMNT_0005259697 /DNA_START=177 /DNA_END=1049 /DNA_ORIENTATION=-